MSGNRVLRRKAETREKLVLAARALITESGVSGLRIHLITERADVGAGSFYNHFGSKEELVEAVLSDSLEELAQTTIPSQWTSEDPAEVTAAALMAFVQLVKTDPEFARLIVNLSRGETLFAVAVRPYARAALEQGVALGRFDVHQVDITVTVAVGGATGLMREMLLGHHDETAPAEFTRMILMSLGLSSDESDAVLDRVERRWSSVGGEP